MGRGAASAAEAEAAGTETQTQGERTGGGAPTKLHKHGSGIDVAAVGRASKLATKELIAGAVAGAWAKTIIAPLGALPSPLQPRPFQQQTN